MANEALSFVAPAAAPGGRDRGRGSAQPAVLLVAGLVVGIWGGVLLWRIVTAEPGGLGPQVSMLRWASIVALAAAFGALLLGANQRSAAYPFVLFAFLHEMALAVFTVGWAAASQSGKVPWEQFGGLAFGVCMSVAMAYAVVLVTAAVVSMLRRPAERTGPPALPVAAGDERLRRRIKAYFQGNPWWPWGLAYLGLTLTSIAAALPARSLLQFSYPFWTYIIYGLFLLAMLRVVLSGGRHLSWYDAPAFLIFAYLSNVLVSLSGATFVRPGYGNAYWSEIWPTILSRYLVVLGLAAAVYAALFRFVVHRRLRRARDGDIEAVATSDTQPILAHGLARLGVDRTRLVAEPLMLRGVPDRDSLGGAFLGSRIGRDDVLRFTPQRCTVMAFTDDQVHYYEATVDLTTGHIVHESVVEFFYQDISNVARVNGSQSVDRHRALPLKGALVGLFSPRTAERRRRIDSLAVNDTVQIEGRDVFQINLESGRALVVVLRDDSFFDTRKGRLVGILQSIGAPVGKPAAASALYQTDLPVSENERVMRNIRALIRDKKRSLLLERA